MTAVTLCPHPVEGWEICGYNIPAGLRAGVVLLFSFWFPGNVFVGWEPHSGRKQSCSLFTIAGVNVF